MQTRQQKLEKCTAAIRAHIARGGTRSSLRGQDLELRYDGLRLEAIEHDEWRDYCAAHGFSVGHTGFDLFA